MLLFNLFDFISSNVPKINSWVILCFYFSILFWAKLSSLQPSQSKAFLLVICFSKMYQQILLLELGNMSW